MKSSSKNTPVIIGTILALLAVVTVFPFLLAGSIWILVVLIFFAIIAIPAFLAMKRRSRNEKNDPDTK